MADLTATPANVRIVRGIEARLRPIKMDVAVTAGQPVYKKSNGNGAIARANAVGTSKLFGIATESVGAGDTCSCMYHGGLAGLGVDAVDPGTIIYLSVTTGGLLADAAATGTGNVVVPVGVVDNDTSPSQTKFVMIDIQLTTAPVAL
jgi:hypothetical protein